MAITQTGIGELEVSKGLWTPETPHLAVVEGQAASTAIEELVAEQGSLITDESRLTREQALATAFAVKAGKHSGRLVCEKLVRLEDQELATIRPSSSFIAHQIRQVYDMNHFRRIGRDIRYGKYGQIQRGFVGLHDDDHVESYLDDLNEHFESEVMTVDDLTWHKIGKHAGFLITIAGHNRQLGIALANLEANGHFDRGIGFQVRVVRNPKFWEALQVQAKENSGQNPHLWERSRQMKTIMAQSAKHGVVLKTDDVAEFFNTDPDQVPRALRYESLPDGIKELVVEDKLPYSGAFELDRLLRLYHEKDVVALAREFAAKKMSSGQIITEIRTREKVKDLPDDIRLLVDAGLLKYKQAEILFDMRVMGVQEEKIVETGLWMALEQPTLTEAREAAEREKRAVKNGDRDMFTDEEGLAPEERAKIEEEYKLNSARASAAKHSKNALRSISAIGGMIKLGAMGQVIDGKPVTAHIDDDFIAMLDSVVEVAIREGEEDKASQMKTYREKLAALKKVERESNQDSLFAT